MHDNFASWLTSHHNQILPRWIETMVSTSHTHSNGNGIHIGASATNLPSDSVDWTALRTQLYDAFVLAARGDVVTFNTQLETISSSLYDQALGLPEVLAMVFDFRRVAIAVWQQNETEPAAVFALLRDLDTLLEQAVESIVRLWEARTEAILQDRISQAEFIAERLSSATEEADRRALQLSVLNRVSQRLSASLESEQLLDLVGQNLREVLDEVQVTICLPKETIPPDETLYVVQTWGDTQESVIGAQITMGDEDIVVQAHTTGQIVSDSSPDPAKQGIWYHPNCGVIALPLLVNARSTGVIVLQDPDPNSPLSHSQQDLARGIAIQAAIALENARLYARIRRFNNELEQLVAERTHELSIERDRLSTLYDITREITSTLDLDALLSVALEGLAQFTQAKHGSILLTEPDTGQLVNQASLRQVGHNYTRFPIGIGIAGWVAEHKQPALVPDVTKDERWVDWPESYHRKREGSMVIVPLMAHHEVVGVITLSHKQTDFFSEDHVRLLTASAGGIAVSIHNANLYNTFVEETARRGELLRQQQETTSKLAAILQSLSDGVLVCDTNGRILSTNAAASHILQRSIEELVLWDLQDLLTRYLGSQVEEIPLRELLARPLDSDNASRMFQAVAQIGVNTINLTLGPVLKEEDGEMIGALLVLRDITREVESDRLKTEFIGTMSHELRTPMTAIKGFTQLLAMGSLGQVNDTQYELLNTIQSNAERMIAVINDVLDITKIETGSVELELRPLHLAEALSGVIAELQPIIKEREHELSVNIPPGLLLVRADSHRLHQVLYNLLANAVKFTARGGHITIGAYEATLDNLPNTVRDNLISNRRYVQVDVCDTGVGIAPHEIDSIFERFYRTENPLKIEAGGTGLGLSLARPLVELLSGQLWVESVLNEGSTFSFVLPAA